MELTIAISLVSITIAVASFVLSRKDKSNDDTGKENYRLGMIDEKLANIEKVLAKIEDKLDSYDEEINIKIEKAIQQHIIAYHKEG